MEKRRFPFDFHIHTTASDGTDTPSRLVEKARRLGLAVIAITDHDSVEGYKALQGQAAGKAENNGAGGEEAEQRGGGLADADNPHTRICRTDTSGKETNGRGDGPLVLPGIEFSCKDEKGKYHILGYNFRLDGSAVEMLAARAHRMRISKVQGRLKFLEERFGFTFTEEEIETLFHRPNPGKPHIGNLMAEKGYARNKDEAILRYINQYHGYHGVIRPEEAIGAILQSGGIPVLAHPLFGAGSERLSEQELSVRLERLMPDGLQGMECYYSGHSPQQSHLLLSMAQERSLLSGAGSDYHGSNKTVLLGDTGLEAEDRLPEPLAHFLERCGIM